MIFLYVSSRLATGGIEVDEKDIIVTAPPIWRKWVGKHLAEMLKATGSTATVHNAERWRDALANL